MTDAAPAASASATSRGYRTPPSAQTCAPMMRAASAVSSTAENCGRPTAVIMRVVHIAPGPTPTFRMVAPAVTRSCTPSAVTMLPAAIGMPRSRSATARSAREHPLLVTVRGVDDEHVDARGGERPRLRRDVAVDADRGGDAEPPAGVDGGAVQRRAQGAAARERADEVAVVQHAHGLGARRRRSRRTRGARSRCRRRRRMRRARARGRRGAHRAGPCRGASRGRCPRMSSMPSRRARRHPPRRCRGPRWPAAAARRRRRSPRAAGPAGCPTARAAP